MNRVQKGLPLLYAVFKAMIPPRKVSDSNRVLLVETGHIGDAIVDASAWHAVAQKAISQQKGVYLLTPGEEWNIFKRVFSSDQMTYIECDKNLFSVPAFRDIVSKLKRIGFDMIIVRPHGNRLAYLLAAMLPAAKRYAIIEKELVSSCWGSIIHRMFVKRYARVIIEDEKSCEKDVLEELLHDLGISEYRMTIMPIPQIEADSAQERPYITIAVDSQSPLRRWPTDRFIALIEELLTTTQDDIILTGSFLEEKAVQQYEEAFRGDVRVKNLIGKLKFDSWVELLRGARFHVGVDSGSIHVAASVGTTVFCLTGVWHGHRFFPYAVYPTSQTSAPICIYKSNIDVLPCFGCAIKKRYGFGNKRCNQLCESGQPCLCLMDIAVSDVIHTVFQTMNREQS